MPFFLMQKFRVDILYSNSTLRACEGMYLAETRGAGAKPGLSGTQPPKTSVQHREQRHHSKRRRAQEPCSLKSQVQRMNQIQRDRGAVTQPPSGEIGRDIDRSVDVRREWGLQKAEWFLSSSIKGAWLAQALDVGG